MGLIADLIGASRSLIEDTLLRVRKIELELDMAADLEPGFHEEPSHEGRPLERPGASEAR